MVSVDFQTNDFSITNLDVPNSIITLSTSGDASNSGVWVMLLNSTSAGYVPKIDTRGTLSNVSISSAFKHLSNYFFGTTSYILDANNNTTQASTIRAIQFSKPILAEGLYKSSITAIIYAGTLSSLTAIDVVNDTSANSTLGLTGKLVNSVSVTETYGTVFYDHGVIVLHRGDTSLSAGSIFSSPGVSGFEIGSAVVNKVRLSYLAFKTRSIMKRAVYFCRAFNQEFNYTFNPTARASTGRLINSLSAYPATFITTIALMNPNNEILAVAKVSPPKKKAFDTEVLFRVQLDFVWLLTFIGPSIYLFLNKLNI